MLSRATAAVLLLTAVLVHLTALAQAPADAVWIDVRTPAEYQQGHLPQARLIPYDAIVAGVKALGLQKDAPIYLYCAVGGRAEMARQQLQVLGYTNVTNAGSLENARRLAARPPRSSDVPAHNRQGTPAGTGPAASPPRDE